MILRRHLISAHLFLLNFTQALISDPFQGCKHGPRFSSKLKGILTAGEAGEAGREPWSSIGRRAFVQTPGAAMAAAALTASAAGSRVPAAWATSAEGLDLTGRVALVTAGDSPLGLDMAVRLAKAGATVVITTEGRAEGEASLARIRALSGRGQDAVRLPLDLASMSSAKECVKLFRASFQDLHLLVHAGGAIRPGSNDPSLLDTPKAGGGAGGWEGVAAAARDRVALTEDGVELEFGAAYLSVFALVAGLLDKIRRAPGGARVVCLVDGAAGKAAFEAADWVKLRPSEDLRRYAAQPGPAGLAAGPGLLSGLPSGYDAQRCHGRAQVALVAFARELQLRLDVSSVPAVSGGACGGSGFGDVSAAAVDVSAGTSGSARGEPLSFLVSAAPALPLAGRGAYFEQRGGGGGIDLDATLARALERTEGQGLGGDAGDMQEARAAAAALWTASERAAGVVLALAPEQPTKGNGPTATKERPAAEGKGSTIGVDYYTGELPPVPGFHT